MIATDPVFKSVGQALFIAYVMEITPPSQKGATQLMIEDLLKRRYGEEPVPRSERSIDMGDMTPLEFRGQCARIRDYVDNRLATYERDAIHARFGHRVTRANGVRGLWNYYKGLCNSPNEQAILALIWAIYTPGVRRRPETDPEASKIGVREYRRRQTREHEWSLRHIEKEYGVSKSTLHRDQQSLRGLTHKLEMLAQGKLEQLFIELGLVGEFTGTK